MSLLVNFDELIKNIDNHLALPPKNDAINNEYQALESTAAENDDGGDSFSTIQYSKKQQKQIYNWLLHQLFLVRKTTCIKLIEFRHYKLDFCNNNTKDGWEQYSFLQQQLDESILNLIKKAFENGTLILHDRQGNIYTKWQTIPIVDLVELQMWLESAALGQLDSSFVSISNLC